MTQPDEDQAIGDHLAANDRGIEAPDADAVEQATPAYLSADPDEIRVGLEVDPADAADQARVVDFEEDYR